MAYPRCNDQLNPARPGILKTLYMLNLNKGICSCRLRARRDGVKVPQVRTNVQPRGSAVVALVRVNALDDRDVRRRDAGVGGRRVPVFWGWLAVAKVKRRQLGDGVIGVRDSVVVSAGLRAEEGCKRSVAHTGAAIGVLFESAVNSGRNQFI